jgi:outer membrane receptor protein involved in Fe transport
MTLMMGGGAQAAEMAGLNTLAQFDMAPKPLSDALLEFTDVTGLGLVFDSRLVSDKFAPAVSGEFSAKIALDLLLADSGLRIVDVGGNTLAIVLQAQVPSPVRTSFGYSSVAPEPVTYEANTLGVIDELLIVATRTANPPYYKFKPTVAVGGEDVKLSGGVNVSDYLFQLPSMLSDITSANTTIFGTPAGLNLADLRGLGPERTLVLVNGRRFVPTYGGSQTLYGVDLNSISASLVERIEIINGGASTSYGGEAVSGVVNFTLQNDIDGWQGAVQAGITERGDREEILASLTYGNKFSGGKGSVVASITIDDQSGLFMADRGATANPSGFALNGHASSEDGATFQPGYGGSSISPPGLFQSVVDAEGTLVGLGAAYIFNDAGDGVTQFSARRDQLYNYTVDHTLLTPLNRVFGTVNLTYDIASGHRFVFENSLADTDVVSQLAPLPLTIGSGLTNDGGEPVIVPLSNPYIPDDVRALLADAGQSDALGLVLQRRMVELGPRRTRISRQTIRSLIGFQGMFAPDWSYDVYYQFGRNKVDEQRDGLMSVRHYAIALDPERCAATLGCTVLNPFGVGNISPEQTAFIKAENAQRTITTRQDIVSAALSGPVDFLTQDATKLTVGLEYRRERLTDDPDPALTNQPVTGSLIFPGSEGSYNVVEAYADVTMPLLADKPWAKELTATFGLRLSEFSNTGSVQNWHMGGFWEPTAGVVLRLSYQSGERAPNIAELFSAGPSGFDTFDDPCSDISPFDPSTFAKNCHSNGQLGVPDGFVQSGSAVDITRFGNPNLEEERSSNLTWGMVFDTENAWKQFPGRLRLAVDIYRIRVDDFIVDLNASQLLGACYNSEGLDNQFCGDNPVTGQPYIQRDALTGNLLTVTNTYINAGKYWLEGYDVELQYTVDFDILGIGAPLDELSVTGLYTRNLDASFQASADAEIEDLRSTAKYPKHRLQAGVSLRRGPVTFEWDVRYRGAAVSQSTFADLEEARLPAVLYNDVAARVRLNDKVTLYGGVRNLFDEEAPRVFGGSVGDTFPEFYDTLGRRFYMGVVFDF